MNYRAKKLSLAMIITLSFMILILHNKGYSQAGQIFQYIENNDSSGLHSFLNSHHIDLNRITNSDGLYPLHYAAFLGKTRLINVLINNGANVNLEIPGDGFAASIATRRGNLECLQKILEAGFNPNLQTEQRGWSLLHWAAAYGQFEIAKMLINNYNANINIYSNNEGNRKLPYQLAQNENYERLSNYLKMKGWMQAAINGDIDFLQEYLNDHIDINIRDPERHNRTALFLAAYSGNTRTVEFLINNGADINIRDTRGETSLWMACIAGNLDIVRMLIRHGATWNESISSYGFPVSQAVANDHLDVIRYFVNEKKFSVNSQDQEGWTLLHWAAKFSSNPAVVRFLVAHGGNKTIQNNDGQIPYELSNNNTIREILNPDQNNIPLNNEEINQRLLTAASTGRGDFILPLINEGANINTRDEEGKTPLHLSAEAGYFRTTRTLINLGANVNSTDNDSLTPLYYAAANGHLNIVRLLIERGAEWRSAFPRYGFPVSAAVANGKLDVVKYFIEELHFNINAQDREGDTFLHDIARFDQLEMGRYLIRNGINIEIRNNNGETALDVARETGHNDIAEFLQPLYEELETNRQTSIDTALAQNDTVKNSLAKDSLTNKTNDTLLSKNEIESIGDSNQTVVRQKLENDHKKNSTKYLISYLKEKLNTIIKFKNYLFKLLLSKNYIILITFLFYLVILSLILYIFILVFFRKKDLRIDNFKNTQLISYNGIGKIDHFKTVNDFENMGSIQDAIKLLKYFGYKNAQVHFQEFFLNKRKNKINKKLLKINFTIKYPDNIVISNIAMLKLNKGEKDD